MAQRAAGCGKQQAPSRRATACEGGCPASSGRGSVAFHEILRF